MNLTQEPTTLHQGAVIAKLEEVQESMVAAVETRDSGTVEGQGLSEQKLDCLKKLVNDVGIDLSDEYREAFFQLLVEYADVFAGAGEELGHTDRLKHSIHTGEHAPVRQAVHRIPPHMKEEVHNLLEDMREKNIIQPSTSPWASPIVLVKKADGTTRLCIDYRKLNALTRKDAYPLPHIEDTLATLAGSRVFSTLDLLSGYWQVGVADEDQEKTAFCTTEGLFEFRVMPFGLCNAPATFQQLMDLVLAGLLWSHCLVYVDDVIILGRDFAEHTANLRSVFQRLRDANLKLKPAKCSFLQSQVRYLGHIVSQDGVAPDPTKTDRVKMWPCPTNTQEVQRFLGFGNYYRKFIRDFATIAKPLYRLTEHRGIFTWTQDCQEAFDILRLKLVTAPMLAYPDYTKPFILDTDASDVGMGGVLSQVGDDGHERVVAFGSKLLTKAERSYCVTRRELLAVVTFTQHFRPYLLGRHFTVRTDHGSLKWLKNFEQPEGQLARWLEKLAEFDFEIIHRGGKKHCNADALSRLPCRQCGRVCATDDQHSEEVMFLSISTDTQQLRQTQLDDPAVGPVITAMESKHKPSSDEVKGMSLECRRLFQLWDQLLLFDGILYRRFVSVDGAFSHNQLVVPQVSRKDVLAEVHSGPMAGHLGEEKTRGRLQERFYWPGQWNDVRNWCNTCAQCASRKTPAPKPRAPLHSVKVGHPMQVMAMDILGPLPESTGGNSYVLVVADYFTRWVEAFAIPNQEAVTVAGRLVNEVFCRFSMPEQIHSDQGAQFESAVIAEICKLLRIQKSRTTPYHPQSDGVVERFNRTLLAMLSTCIEEHPFEWEEHLKKVCFAYNTSIHSTTGETPFFLMFGRQARLPVDLLYNTPLSVEERDVPTYVFDLKNTLTSAYERVRSKTSSQQMRQKENYDRKVHGDSFKPGDMVWLFNPAVPRGKARKFHRPWTGPHRVLQKISTSNFRIQHAYNHKKAIVHFDRLKRCSPGMRFSPTNRLPLPRTQQPPDLPGTHIELPDDDLDEDEIPMPRRYPLRNRRAPVRLEPFVAH